MESFWAEFVESFCARFWFGWLAELLSLSLSLVFARCGSSHTPYYDKYSKNAVL